MKKLRYAVLLGLLCVSLAGCGTGKTEEPKKETVAEEDTAAPETEEVAEETSEQEEASETEAVEAPFVKLKHVYYEMDEEDAWQYFTGSYELASVSGDGYDALKTSVENWFDNLVKNFEDEARRMYEDAVSMQEEYGQMDDAYPRGSYMNDTVKTARADGRIVSFQMGSETYTYGAAHGMNFNYGVTFDSKTGKELAFSDLGDIREDVKEYIKNGIADDADLLSSMIVDDFKTTVDEAIDGEPTWYLTGTGLMVVFNEYELLSYAAGDYVAFIPYEEMSAFKEEYLPQSTYFSPIEEYASIQTDLMGDGSLDRISIQTQYNEDYMATELYLEVNDNRIQVEDYCYQAWGYYIHTEAGDDYVVTCASSENDFVNSSLIKIEDGTPKVVDSVGMTVLAVSGDRMWTERKVDTLGSYGGYATIIIDNDKFSRVEERFEFIVDWDLEWRTPLVTTKEIPVRLTENGELKDTTLPVGSQLYPCNGDGTSVVGFTLPDGTYGEVYFDASDWPHTIDGVDENECFEMLPYAG